MAKFILLSGNCKFLLILINTKQTVLGALAGIAAGALIGVLLAPEKGSKVRSKIVKQGEDYLDKEICNLLAVKIFIKVF